MKAFSALGAAAFAIMLAQPASADTIFSDAFNRSVSATVGNSWTETESGSATASIVHITGAAAGDNQLQLQGRSSNNSPIDAAVAQLSGLSTTDLTNITLSFDYLGIDGNVPLVAQWKLHSGSDSDWITLASIALSDSSFPLNASGPLSLGASAENALIDIRLFTNVGNGTPADNDGAYVDNLVLSGTSTAVAVPGPMVGAGLPGLAMAFGGLGVWWRRRKALTS